MNILIIPDSFKDSLSASEVADAIEAGISEALPEANVMKMFASDGGEGFLDSVLKYVPDCEKVTTATVDPLGRPVTAYFLFEPKFRNAYIELAQASGLELLSGSERNPMQTSTYGTGLQIEKAIAQGAEKIYVGLGGSATNDGGTGMAEALGVRFFDTNGKQLHPKGHNLVNIESLTTTSVKGEGVAFYAVNDVRNPLTGPSGAAHTYARQKGAAEADITRLEEGLSKLSKVCAAHYGVDHSHAEGSGAAGGSAYGLKTFLNAEFVSGVSFMLELANFDKLISERGIDLIFTGEGCLDHQTKFGKLVSGVALKAKPFNIPVVAICGKLNLDETGVSALWLHKALELYDPAKPGDYSYLHASSLISRQTARFLGNYP